MIKKLLILPIFGVIGLGITSANTLSNGLTSDADITPGICEISSSNLTVAWSDYGFNKYFCFVISPSSTAVQHGESYTIYNDNSVYCSQYGSASNWQNSISFASAISSCDVYASDSEITWVAPVVDTPSDDDDNMFFPTIPSSFTSGITAVISNFGSIIVGWLPTIILVSMGIFAIFMLFRVVRNYARSTFNG